MLRFTYLLSTDNFTKNIVLLDKLLNFHIYKIMYTLGYYHLLVVLVLLNNK